MEKLIGRETEREILQEALASTQAELVAVYGRRRVGKTFLIRTVYEEHIAFELSGIHEAKLSVQLENFSLSLQGVSGSQIPIAVPRNWLQAFAILQQYLSEKLRKKKAVVFFDEFPWLHSQRSGFLAAFEHFWNSWASRQAGLVVVICGSAASWMIENIVNNKGGLHN